MAHFSGFSKLDRAERIDYIVKYAHLTAPNAASLYGFDASQIGQQVMFEEMIENYTGNFPVPMGVVPNMVINGTSYLVPYATEESSVVAAASKAAKYWADRGGFEATVKSLTKKGQVHFFWQGDPSKIRMLFPALQMKLLQSAESLTQRMRSRGGGIREIVLLDKTKELPNYYQVDVSFRTAEAMGANFINSCLEKMALCLQTAQELISEDGKPEVVMSILSNYTPDCRVTCFVEAPIAALTGWSNTLSPLAFAMKFKQAVEIAQIDVARAVTHNKGIFNGMDAVLLASGNDLRATAAAGHAFAARSGTYQSLTSLSLDNDLFRYTLEVPLALGTVGGITHMHPVVNLASAMMNHPDARSLMMIVAASGLASNFSAIASLITSGIQEGHMKMHLSNILNQLNASDSEKDILRARLGSETVNYEAVEQHMIQIRNHQ